MEHSTFWLKAKCRERCKYCAGYVSTFSKNWYIASAIFFFFPAPHNSGTPIYCWHHPSTGGQKSHEGVGFEGRHPSRCLAMVGPNSVTFKSQTRSHKLLLSSWGWVQFWKKSLLTLTVHTELTMWIFEECSSWDRCNFCVQISVELLGCKDEQDYHEVDPVVITFCPLNEWTVASSQDLCKQVSAAHDASHHMTSSILTHHTTWPHLFVLSRGGHVRSHHMTSYIWIYIDMYEYI